MSIGVGRAVEIRMLLEVQEKVDPRHAALLILDPYAGQDDSTVPDERQRIVPALNRLISATREVRVPIVWIFDDEQPPWCELENWQQSPDRRGDGLQAHRVLNGLAPQGSDLILAKHSFSPYAHGPLDLILRCRGIRTVMLSGGDVLGSIETTAKDSFVHGYYVVFVRDCVYPPAGANHEIPLAYMGLRVGTV